MALLIKKKYFHILLLTINKEVKTTWYESDFKTKVTKIIM